MEAAVQCLIDIGYTQTTTEKIASMAGVSRGAMTHHFKSRAEVFEAVANYIVEQRAIEYEKAISRIEMPSSGKPDLKAMRATISALQKYYAVPTFIAYRELLLSARSDKDLHRILVPLSKSLDEKISTSLVNKFPIWSEFKETSEVLRDLILHTLQGIAFDYVAPLSGSRLQNLLDLLAIVSFDEFNRALRLKRTSHV
ncbi:TetR/AcrR family transcriptional regulator [Paraburkholderia sp. BR14374]|uniref:TetR/AcrR family transcriptional regulator n=1 Tax=Paraburkholderia sp. BR14374 TaxID=3237007 RepID=UPI0034CE94FC